MCVAAHMDSKVAQHEDGHRVGWQVGKPQDQALYGIGAMLPSARTEEEEDLQEHANKDQAMDLPRVPQLFHSRHPTEDWWNSVYKLVNDARSNVDDNNKT